MKSFDGVRTRFHGSHIKERANAIVEMPCNEIQYPRMAHDEVTLELFGIELWRKNASFSENLRGIRIW